MANSMTQGRDSRQHVQLFDVDLFRNKLETYMRKQATEMCEPVNTKKRKLSERWSDLDKEDMELTEDYRDDLVYQFGKRQRGSSYYPIDDDELEMEEVSPLTLPSPVSVMGDSSSSNEQQAAWPYIDGLMAKIQPSIEQDGEDIDPLSMAMRRQLSGYSEASAASHSHYSTMAYADSDDSWMSPCPPLSRASISYSSSSMPDTPNNGPDESHDQLSNHLTATATADLDLDLNAMAPHERTLLAALAPERFEKASLIKRAFRQSEKLLDQFARENHLVSGKEEHDDMGVDMMQMDDGEYDEMFGELMHV